MQSPAAAGGKSSAPRPYIGYVSSQWHTKQTQPPQQLAAISWCRSPAYRATERAVLMPWSTEGKNPKKTPRQNRVLCGGKWDMGVGMGISDSPRQLMNQPQRATPCSITGSRSIRSSVAAAGCLGHAVACCCRGEIECSAAVYRLCKSVSYTHLTLPTKA